jgi:hypothetical protein
MNANTMQGLAMRGAGGQTQQASFQPQIGSLLVKTPHPPPITLNIATTAEYGLRYGNIQGNDDAMKRKVRGVIGLSYGMSRAMMMR